MKHIIKRAEKRADADTAYVLGLWGDRLLTRLRRFVVGKRDFAIFCRP